MDTKSGPRKSAGWVLAVIAMLGFGLAQLAIPVRLAAQENTTTAQPHQARTGDSTTVNPLRSGRTTNPNWSGGQAFVNQGACGGGQRAPFFDGSSESIFGSEFDSQPLSMGSAGPSMQSWFGGSQAAFWYGYNSSQLAGWSIGSNLTPTVAMCGSFQGLTP